MNLHTFKDAVTSKRQALANELDDEEDDTEVGTMADNVDGEEEDGADKFNEIGEVIEPFNLKQERERGHFDANMNYVWRKEKVEPDAWLADMDEAAMEKSIGEAAEALRKKQEKEDEEKGPIVRSQQFLKIELLKILNPGERVIDSIRRLGGQKGKQAKLSSGKRGRPQERPSQSNKEAMNSLTDISDQLISGGLTGLYEMSYEAIEASMFMWEYKGRDDAIHGPFTTKQISEWRKQGFFTGSSAVYMRKVSEALDEAPDDHKRPDVLHEDKGRNTTAGPPSKKRKTDSDNQSEVKAAVSGGSNQDLIDDLNDDDDDEDEGKADARNERLTEEAPSKVLNRQSNAPKVQYGPWVLSDDIDFGDFVDLPEEAEVEVEEQLDNDEKENGDEE